MTRLAAVAVLVLTASAAPAQRREIDPEVVAAWVRSGAKVEWYGRTKDGGWQITPKDPDDPRALAALVWPTNLPPDNLAKLPAPNVPFALFLSSAPGLQQCTDDDMKHLRRFKRLRHLAISGTLVTDVGLHELVALEDGLESLALGSLDISDDGLKELGKLPCLRYLVMGNSPRITDAGLRYLGRLHELRTLGLTNTKVTDAGLKHLADLGHLEELYLGGNQVTDAGLPQLYRLKNLRVVVLVGTQVTDQGVAALVKERPGVKVMR
jgi:hypothetical protein